MRGRETAASRAKADTLTTLKRDLGKERIGHLDRQKLIGYGKMRAEQGASPVTLGIDIGVRPCCTNCLRDSPHESSMIAGRHEQLGPYEVQDHELVGLQ